MNLYRYIKQNIKLEEIEKLNQRTNEMKEENSEIIR